MSVEVHPLSNNPTRAWKELSATQKVIKITVPVLPKSLSNDKVIWNQIHRSLIKVIIIMTPSILL